MIRERTNTLVFTTVVWYTLIEGTLSLVYISSSQQRRPFMFSDVSFLTFPKARKRRREETMASDPERTFSGPEREYIKETYDVMLGTFKEYAEMVIQVGLLRFLRRVGLSGICFLGVVFVVK